MSKLAEPLSCRCVTQRVLVIGATSAVAQAFVRRRCKEGARLYLIARNPDKLRGLSDQLGDAVVGSESGDLAQGEANAARIERAVDVLGGLDEVLIAHGYLGDQLESERDFEQAQRTLNTNLLSPVSLLIPIANHCEAQGAGHIGVITSVAGERGRPRNFTYGTAKGGLTRYLEGLRSRLWGSGVEVHNFKLGPVDSPMTVDHEKNATFTTPERAAELIARGMRGRRHEIFVPGYWRWIMLVVRTMPEPIFQRLRFLSGR